MNERPLADAAHCRVVHQHTHAHTPHCLAVLHHVQGARARVCARASSAPPAGSASCSLTCGTRVRPVPCAACSAGSVVGTVTQPNTAHVLVMHAVVHDPCHRAQDTDGCNVWVVCTTPGDCGSGCQAYAARFECTWRTSTQAAPCALGQLVRLCDTSKLLRARRAVCCAR
jgi:hypothetical protein